MHYDSWEILPKITMHLCIISSPNQMGPIEWPLLVVFLLFFGSFPSGIILTRIIKPLEIGLIRSNHPCNLSSWFDIHLELSKRVDVLTMNAWCDYLAGWMPKIIHHNPFPCSLCNLRLQKKQSKANTSSSMVEMDSIVKRLRNVSSNSNLPRDLNRNKPLKNRLTD